MVAAQHRGPDEYFDQTAIDSTRPSLRTFSYSASTQTYFDSLNGRSRNCRTFSSRDEHNWLTWPADTPAIPNSPSTASILRVETPCTTASWITLIRACSLRFRFSMK